MTDQSVNMNMFSDENNSHESYSDGEFTDDSDFDDVGSTFTHRYEQEEQTNELQLEHEQEQEDDRRTTMKIQEKDTIKFILPDRKMPSDEEMYICWQDYLDAEQKKIKRDLAIHTIKDWLLWCVLKRRSKQKQHYEKSEERRNKLTLWQKSMKPPHIGGIVRLSPLPDFEIEYAKMCEMKDRIATIKKGLEWRIEAMVANKARKLTNWKIRVASRKAGKARAIAKIGLNKNTTWHMKRRAGALTFKEKKDVRNEAGDGRRSNRKIRQEKEKIDAIDLAVKDEKKKQARKEYIQSITLQEEDERTDKQKQTDKEEKKIDQDDEKEVQEALILINRKCIEKFKLQDEEQKKENESKKMKKEDEKDEDYFVKTISSNMGIEIKDEPMKIKKKKIKKKVVLKTGFKGLIDVAVDKRKAVDETYAARCNGFDDATDTEKMKETLKYTSLCRSVKEKKKCYHTDCRFAHSIDQLQRGYCRFGKGCKFVKTLLNGQYANCKFGRSGKSCSFFHPDEHDRGFCNRMGLKYIPKKTEEKTEKTVIKSRWEPPVSTLIRTWAKVMKKTETDEKIKDFKSKMTKKWNEVVIETLSEEQKVALYGKGVQILGYVSDERCNEPFIQPTKREKWDKRGLGFSTEPRSASTKLVTVKGFNWVKGEVLQPPDRELEDTVMAKVIEAVQLINKKIERKIAERVQQAKVKAQLINKKIEKKNR